MADRGFASAANRSGGACIHAEKLGQANVEAAARPGRYRTVADDLRVEEVARRPRPGQ